MKNIKGISFLYNKEIGYLEIIEEKDGISEISFLGDIDIETRKNLYNIFNESPLTKVPYGETISYSDEAKMIGNDKAVRAVGSANGKNCIPIIIPCHRIISKDGKLGGYSGGEGGNKGIEIKKYLLELEKKFK